MSQLHKPKLQTVRPTSSNRSTPKIGHMNNFTNNVSINSELSSSSSISSIHSTIHSTANETNNSTLIGDQISSIGSISMSRSAASFKQNNNNNNNNNSSIKESFSIKSSPLDLVKQIEELVARNKTLEEENLVLKYSDNQTSLPVLLRLFMIYLFERNLIHEEKTNTNGSKEFDERRILMLKCQIYQLEKQINILTKITGFRKNAHTDALNTISVLSDSFRTIVQTAESRSLNPVTQITIAKSDLIRWTELSESTRIKLEKTEDNNYEDLKKQSEPSLLNSSFAKPNRLDILDICSGNLDHINLKQVALLESNLAQLFKKLFRLKESLKTIMPRDNNSKLLLPLHKDNLKIQLDDCIKSTQETCRNLFDLSLIVPSAPWPSIRPSPIHKFTQENLITKLKSINLPKLKYQSVECLFKSYHVAVNYHYFMQSLEIKSLNEQVAFYRGSYSVQKEYIDSLMNLFRTKYIQFIAELKESLDEPIRNLMQKFNKMKEESSEENLKSFLAYFKLYSKKFEKIFANTNECLPSDDLIGTHFNELIFQLDEQISNLNKQCAYNLEEFRMEKLNLEELSIESDNLLNELVKLTPNISPSESLTDLQLNQ